MEQGSLVDVMALGLSREWPEVGHQLWWSPQLESYPQLDLSALMVQEYQSEVVEDSDAAVFDKG